MARINIRLTPRAKRDAIESWRDGVLRVRVTAPPVDGKANAALLQLLADALVVPRRDLAIVTGATTRDKCIEVSGLDNGEARLRLGTPAF